MLQYTIFCYFQSILEF